ncbi:hybrid sensor histidine kinase/response regulator transcription factor [Polaribacter sp. M15]
MKSAIKYLGLLLSIMMYSQKNDVNYIVDFVTTEQGLSHNFSTSILSDDLNIKWIGTENGITKYNGFDFEYIKPGERYKELLNENIEVLFKDYESNIWIGTKSGGLSYLNTKTNKVINIDYLIDTVKEGDLRITAISQDLNGNIWAGTWKHGVFIIDYKNNKVIKRYNYSEPTYSIIRGVKNNMWFCRNNMFYKFNISSNELKTYKIKGLITDLLSDPSREKIWITPSGKNTFIYSFNLKTESIEKIETGIVSNFSKKLSIDKYHRLWIGTWGQGVYRSNEDISVFSKINLISSDSEKIGGNYNTILNIHHDKNNITWLATASGGVVKLLEGNGFKNASNLIKNNSLKKFLNCTSIYKNKEEVFLGTVFLGLWHGKNFSDLTKIEEIGNDKINALYENNKKLYIGTSNGFYIYDLNLRKIVFSCKEINKVTSFLVDNNLLFIGTQQRGLAIVNLKNINNLKLYQFYSEDIKNKHKIKSDRVTTIVRDSKDNIWVGTYNGLELFDKEKKVFINQSKLLKDKLPSIIINAIALKDNFIWLATPGGLIKLSYSNRELKIESKITKKNGLNSDFICAITFDNQSNLWLTTHTEIVKYNDKNKSIICYNKINGVKSTSFNNRSFYNYDNEFIAFGGFDNITFFNPSKIKDFNVIPEIIFTSLRVNNKLIDYKSDSIILNKNFSYAKEINLSHKDKFFSTRFIVNDYLGKSNIKYKYQLESYQKDWIDLQNQNEISFAGLLPGTYTLKVKASRDNQNWSAPKSIDIKLLNSPFKSIWAIIIYLLFISWVIFYLVKSNNYKLKLQNKLEISRIDREKEIELTEAKLTFFTNISHEFRTPLTLIISPLKELLESENIPKKIYRNLSYIDKNTNRLLNLINQLLDFRKADQGLLKLNISQGNFVRFSKEVFLYFKDAAEAKNIKYKFKPVKNAINFPFDRNKMEIVLCNLISNAIKYTKSGDEITITITTESNYCIIVVKDTGIGMDEKNLDKIFDRFFQIKTAETARLIGSGIGLSFSKKIVELHHGEIKAKSQKNKGTEFIVKLSMDTNLYKSINENYIKTDNISAYNTSDVALSSENFNKKEKEQTILIIDDNVEILSYLKDILSEDYTVIQAENGNIGLEKASSSIPDLIISDIMMPGKDGITLCKELKSSILTSHIPIILLTARTSTVYQIEGLERGADDYITKPFNAKVIKARIANLFENREKIQKYLLNKVRLEPTPLEIEDDIDIEKSFINKAILLVENNLDNPSFGIENMVDEFCMSQSTLYRKIKSLTGLSTTAFIRSIRIKRAAQLILKKEDSISSIAYIVGFNDLKYFRKCFKEQFGVTPSKYKK